MGAIDDIKERLDIVEIISGYTPLQKAGRNYKALCPFHSEKTPSFVVFPDTQTWHCFGACNAGGDVFSFVMRRENMEFGEALRLLAQRAGVSLEPLHEGEEAETRLKERLYKLNALAAEYFHYLLLNSPEGARARDYLTGRGLSAETRKTFQLGYAREDWQALGQHLTAKGYSWSDLMEAGLVIEGKEHGYYDRFRGRLIFPIRDARANVVGFGARALDDSLPKYLNSPQTAIFDKSGVLYGIDQAKGAIREAGLVVIVEGYMDVLMAHQCNRKNVVASMGTALTEKHVRIIKKMTKKLVLALDADTAGDQATVRGLEVAKEAFDRRAMPVPTWRGLIRYEDQLDAEIGVAVLPPGLDPDEVLKENVDTWDALVNRALPVVEYYLQAVIGKFDLRSAKDKVAAAREVLPLIREIGSAVERSHYLQQLAHLLRVDERTLQQELEGRKATPGTTGRGTGRREPAPAAERFGRLSAQPGLTFGLEQYVLLLLLKRPESLTSMNALLLGLGMEPLTGEDLTEIDKRAIFEWIAAHIEQRRSLDLDALRQEVDPSLRPALEAVLSLIEGVAFLSDEQAELDAVKCALRLRELRLHRRNEELRYLHEDARSQSDGEAAKNWGRMVDELAIQLVRIQREEAAQSSLKSPRQEQTQG
jgi:DNA primase